MYLLESGRMLLLCYHLVSVVSIDAIFMDKVFGVIGCVSGFLAVAAGAFGAHSLRGRLAADQLAVFETAARYEMYHALALIGAAWVAARWPSTSAQVAGWAFVTGSVLFCGSLYLLTLTNIRWLGAITPLGGGAFLVGWLALAWAVWSGV